MKSAVRLALCAALFAPALAAVAVARGWDARGARVSGDEPHYLIIADAIEVDRRLAVIRAYRRDEISKHIFGPVDWQHHSVTRQHGTYSIHSVGLPILIAPVFGAFGLSGVRVLLCAIAGFVPFLFFTIARTRGLNANDSVLLSVSAAMGLPLLAAGGQIYPDFIVGVILLALTAIAFAGSRTWLSAWWLVAAGLLVAVLPWLHVKNAVAAVTMGATVFAIQACRPPRLKNILRLAWLIAPPLCSAGLLAWYNRMAFGDVLGPYTSEQAAGATASQALMIFLGLHLDQAQGMFIQQPLFRLGLPGLAFLARQSRMLACGIMATYLAIIVPNSFHTCWYGCWSISGRFMWSVAGLWFVPLVFLYNELPQTGRQLVRAACLVSVVWQAYLALHWWPGGLHALYTSAFSENLAARNSLFIVEWRHWLPSYYDFDHYLTYLPNVVASVAIVLLVTLGIVSAQWLGRDRSPLQRQTQEF